MIKLNNKAMCELLNADIEYMMKHCDFNSIEAKHIMQILQEMLYKHSSAEVSSNGSIDKVAYLKDAIAHQIVDDIYYSKSDNQQREGFTEDDMINAMYKFLDAI